MKLRIFFFVILIASINSQAQSSNFGTWIELEFRKDFLKKFNFNITPELRLQNHFRVEKYMIEGQLSYDPYSFLSFKGGYRASNEIKIKNNMISHRFALDMKASQNINQISVSLRSFYTSTYSSSDDKGENYLRPRLKVDYNIKGGKFTPFASYELFQNLKTKKLDKSRKDIGFTQRLGKLNRVGLSYFYRLEDNFTSNESIHIIRIEYKILNNMQMSYKE